MGARLPEDMALASEAASLQGGRLSLSAVWGAANGALAVEEALPRLPQPIPVPEAILRVEKEVVAQPKQPWRPPPDHPWRKYPACTPSRSPSRPPMDAKI